MCFNQIDVCRSFLHQRDRVALEWIFDRASPLNADELLSIKQRFVETRAMGRDYDDHVDMR